MKLFTPLLALAALSVAACGGEQKPADSNATPSAAASSASAATAPTGCLAVVNSGDSMTFDVKEIVIPSTCKEFTVTLKHGGKLPAVAMGHNIVISKVADKEAVLKAGMEAGVDNQYVQPNDSRVVAYTKLIGGGQEDSVSFDVAKFNKNEAYEFYCSFPSHSAGMNGKITFTN